MAEKEIDAISEGLKKMLTSGTPDPCAMDDHYTDDVTIMAPGIDILRGKEGAKKFSASLNSDKMKEFKQTRLSFIDCGEYAIETMTWKMIAKDDSVIFQGKSTIVWKKGKDGKWRVHIDATIPDTPKA